MRALSTDISNIIVLAFELTKDCFLIIFVTGIGICSVLFSGIFKFPIFTELFRSRDTAFTPAAPSTTLAVEAAAEVVFLMRFICVIGNNDKIMEIIITVTTMTMTTTTIFIELIIAIKCVKNIFKKIVHFLQLS